MDRYYTYHFAVYGENPKAVDPKKQFMLSRVGFHGFELLRNSQNPACLMNLFIARLNDGLKDLRALDPAVRVTELSLIREETHGG